MQAPQIFREKGTYERAEVGAYTGIGPGARMMAWRPEEKIVIGKYCSIGPEVVVFTGGEHRTDFVTTSAIDFILAGKPFLECREYRSTANTTIGNDVWMGMRSMVLGGVTVGDGAVVGAGAVVVADVPPYAIVSGNPARIIRYRFSRRVVEDLLRIRWWDWPVDKVIENIDLFHAPITEFVERFRVEGS